MAATHTRCEELLKNRDFVEVGRTWQDESMLDHGDRRDIADLVLVQAHDACDSAIAHAKAVQNRMKYFASSESARQ